MKKLVKMYPNERKQLFFLSLNLSSTTLRGYKSAFTSSLLKELLLEKFQEVDLFAITDIEKLSELDTELYSNPANIRSHRLYSSALRKYISFLNGGNKYRVSKTLVK